MNVVMFVALSPETASIMTPLEMPYGGALWMSPEETAMLGPLYDFTGAKKDREVREAIMALSGLDL